LIAGLVLGYSGQGLYYTIMASIAFASCFIFLFLTMPPPKEDGYDLMEDTPETNFKKDIADTF